MPRVATSKSYGRAGKDTFASRAFDAVVLKDSGGRPSTATKAASTIKRWGNTSFTSTRGNVEQEFSRKRKVEAAEESPSDSMFDDPFSFDSDDDGPKKPSRGMGYKKEDPPAKVIKTAPLGKAPGSSKLKKDENNEERDTMKTAPNRTYSKGLRLKTLDNGSSKQLSIEAFTTKQSNRQNTSSQVRNVPRKFFTSRNASQNSSGNSQTSQSSTMAASSQNFNFFDDSEEADDRANDSVDLIEVSSINENESENGIPDQETEEEEAAAEKVVQADSPLTIISSCGKGEEDSDHDTDSVDSQTSSQRSNNKGRISQSYSQNSVASNGSNGSGSFCDKLKWDNRPIIKISSMDRNEKEKDKPLVRRLLTSPKKSGRLKKAVYNPRQWHDSDEEDLSDSTAASSSQQSSSQQQQKKKVVNPFAPDFDAPTLPSKDVPKIRRKVTDPGQPGWTEPVTKVNINKEHKPLYTVVRNVKQAHECQEYGETQEFQDDIDYLMDGLGDKQTVAVRCLSAITLTSKCVSSAFRMHLRAHGILDRIFGKLHDAHKFPNLALCTASVMYFVSRDRFSMDLEPHTLELMLNLLSAQDATDAAATAMEIVDAAAAGEGEGAAEYQRTQEKIREICRSLQNEGTVKVELPEDVSVGQLAMETLLSLTSKRAGEWFKEELRTLGGLEHIVNSVTECVEELDEFVIDPTDAMLKKLKKIERCLRVLENVTYLNADNQSYLITYKDGLLLKDLCHTLRVCENCLPFSPVDMDTKGKVNKECPGYIIFTCLLSVLRVLLNLTHDNAFGSTRIGKQEQLLKTVLITILRVPQYIPGDQRFDVLVLGLGLLINLVEHCDHNRELLIDTEAVQPYDDNSPHSKVVGAMESLEALAKLFLIRYEAARRIEEEHDAKLEEKERRKKRRKKEKKMEMNSQNKSGEWKESESGLEWISSPHVEDEEKEEAAAGETADRVGEDNGEEEEGSEESENEFDVMQNQDEDENTDFTEALHKAGKHMEGCILAAYVGLLLGCTIQGNSEHIDRVRNCLPEGDFVPMIRMLRKFLGFMNFTSCISGSSGSKSITHIIEVLEAC